MIVDDAEEYVKSIYIWHVPVIDLRRLLTEIAIQLAPRSVYPNFSVLLFCLNLLFVSVLICYVGGASFQFQ